MDMENKDAMDLDREQQKEREFIEKWLPDWARTPSRLYWALVSGTVRDEDRVQMATDLVAICDFRTPNDISFLHAQNVLKKAGVKKT